MTQLKHWSQLFSDVYFIRVLFLLGNCIGVALKTNTLHVNDGGSPGLVVMGGDSYSKGREFKSRHHILDGHFFTYLFVVKFVLCV